MYDTRPCRPAPAALPLSPFGIPLRVDFSAMERPRDLDPAFEGWMAEGRAGGRALRLRIEQRDDLAGTQAARVSVRGTVVAIDGPGVSAWADSAAGLATCGISREYLAAPRRLREDVLDPMVLAMVAWRDRSPVHAAAFVADGVAVLLAGRSGAGKSCLAAAADRAGFQLLSDDTVYVQLKPCLRIWGWPRRAHLLPADAGEAAGPSRLRNGTLKQVVTLRSATPGPISAGRAVLCVLAKGGGPRLSPLGGGEVSRRLFPLDPGFDMLPRQIGRALRALACRGAWELRLSDDPDAAVRLLSADLQRLKETAAP